MKRTLTQLGIAQLEELFASSKADSKSLKVLQNELRHRQVPRALQLLEQVDLSLKRLVLVDMARTPAPAAGVQLALHDSVDVVDESAYVNKSLGPDGLEKAHELNSDLARERLVRTFDEWPHTPVTTVEEACKVLQVGPATPWQDVEMSRRRLVQTAHPALYDQMTAHDVSRSRAQARRVNAAYAVLSQARTR